MGLRSVPITWAEGYCSARNEAIELGSLVFDKVLDEESIRMSLPNSVAHKPVPVPISKTLWSSEGRGAKCNCPSNDKENK